MSQDMEAQTRSKNPAPFSEFENGGYPKLAHLMGTYGELAIFRKFGALNSFILLSLQADLVKLEKQLDYNLKRSERFPDHIVRMFTKSFEKLHKVAQRPDEKQDSDKQDSDKQASDKQASDKQASDKQALEKQDPSPEEFARRINNIIVDITNKLDQYNRMVVQFSQVSTLRNPRSSDIKYLRDWLGGSYDGEGNNFLSDFERRTWEEEFTEDLLVADNSNDDRDIFSKDVSPGIIKMVDMLGFHRFKKPIDNSGTIAYSGLKRTMRVLTTTLAAILPAVSILALYYCDNMPLRIGVMITITFGFSMILSLFTSANRIEIFSATAAFAAVEVVFIGSATLNNGSARV